MMVAIDSTSVLIYDKGRMGCSHRVAWRGVILIFRNRKTQFIKTLLVRVGILLPSSIVKQSNGINFLLLITDFSVRN